MINRIKSIYFHFYTLILIYYKKFEINSYFNSLKEHKNISDIGQTLYIKEIITLNKFMKAIDRNRYNPCMEKDNFCSIERIFRLVNEIDELYKNIGK